MTFIEKLKALFSVEKFLDAKLVDGTIIRTEADEFKVGDKATVITEAGEEVKAPEGMHELEDGTVLVIDAEGIITEVRKPEVKEEEMSIEEVAEQVVEDVVEEAVEEVIEEKTDKIAELEERVKALEEAMTILVGGLESSQTEMKNLKNENKKLKAELSKAPAGSPAKIKKTEISDIKPTKFGKKSSFKVDSELLSRISELRNK